MSRTHKQWLAAGLLVVAAGAGGMLLRHHRAEQALRLRGADGPTLRGLTAGAGETSPGSLLAPETPEEIDAQVKASLAAWRNAVIDRNADAVLALDRAFLSAPDPYRAALETSARTDVDERVRAFSTRVLGKLRSAALAPLFEALLADKSPFVRQNAAWALGELAGHDDGRVAARHAAAELRHARAKDPAPDVRTAAKGALARLE